MQIFGVKARFKLIRYLGVTLLLLCFLNQGKASDEQYFSLTDPIRKYYQAILILDWHVADSLATAIKITEPDNALVYLFDNYSTVSQLLIRDKESDFRSQKRIKDAHLKRLKKSDKNSPYYRYVRAEILLQWAILNYKYENRLTVLKDIWTAYGLLEENLELFPDFISTYRSIGILHAFMGTMPISDNMKWLLEKTSGMSGSIEQGMSELKKVVEYGNQHQTYIFHEECKGLYAYLLHHLANQPAAAWEAVQTINITSVQSALAGYVIASIALKTGHLDDCLAHLGQIKKEHRSRLPFNYFIQGKAELYQGNKLCERSFNQFLMLYEGDSYRLAAHQKIAWNYLIHGDEASYHLHMNECLADNKLIVGEDKDARQEAQNISAVNRFLLQARILFDGYQYESALEILNSHDDLGMNTNTSLEYYYRRGRIYQGLQLHKASKNDLERAYLIGEQSHAYYACNAALQIGLLYETSDELHLAKNWYESCLDLYPDAYRKSLHHKAKSGLKRVVKE